MERANLRGCMIVFISPAFSKWVLPAGNWWRSGRRSQSRAHTPYALSLWIDDPGRIKCQLFPANMYARRTAGCEVDALAVLMPRRTLCGKCLFRLRCGCGRIHIGHRQRQFLQKCLCSKELHTFDFIAPRLGWDYFWSNNNSWMEGKIVLIQYPHKYFKFGNSYWEKKLHICCESFIQKHYNIKKK